MNKLLLSGFLIALAFGTMGRPVEQVNTHVTQFPNATNQTCQECEKLVEIISIEEHKMNHTLAEIIKIVRDICQDIGGPSGKECIFVVNNIQEIVNWITAGLTPNNICHKLGFCSNTTQIHRKNCINDL